MYDLTTEPGVYPRADWLTFIAEGLSLQQIFEFVAPTFDVPEDMINQALSHMSLHSFTGMGLAVPIQLPFVYLQVPQTEDFDPLGIDNPNYFEAPLKKVRIELSGERLEYLRTMGYDIEDWVLHMPGNLPGGVHITRCDYAFDFVNFKADLFDQLYEYCESVKTEKGRIPTGRPSGIYYEAHTGSKKVIYFGKGDDILRVYDKRLQALQNADDESIETLPNSWIRFEWQQRNHQLSKYHFIHERSSYKMILGDLYDHWSFRKAAERGTHDKSEEDENLQKIFQKEMCLNLIRKTQILRKEERIINEKWLMDGLRRYFNWADAFLSWYGIERLCDEIRKEKLRRRNSTLPADKLKEWRTISILTQLAYNMGLSDLDFPFQDLRIKQKVPYYKFEKRFENDE